MLKVFSKSLLTAFGVLAVGTVTAACGPSTTSSAPPAAAASGSSTAKAASVDTAEDPRLGTILVDGRGFTLYRLNRDSKDRSVCRGACAKAWPPLLAAGRGTPVAGPGVSRLGTIEVPGGQQVTYKGVPLYTFIGDHRPGQVNGQDLKDRWGTWFVLTAGAPAGGTKTTPTTTGGGGGGPAF